MKVRQRFFKVVKVFFKLFLAFQKEFKLVRKKGFKKAQDIMEKTHYKRANELYDLAISLGGVMIKMCQFFSTRRDIFPEPYIKVLSPLQDAVPSVPFERIECVLKKDFGDYTEIFDSISPEPIASASLGQTHIAYLKDGSKVVLKVLKPDTHNVIDIDFAIIHRVFKLFSNFKAFKQRGDFFDMLDEFIKVTGDELNFYREVYIAKLLKEKLAKFSYLKIPYMYADLCTENVIVMEYCSGDKITNIDKWKNRGNDPKIIAKRLIEVYLEQFLFIKTIHFDPHPGNILISEDNRIILLDFGMSGEITEEMSTGIKDSLRALSKRDYRKVLDILVRLRFLRKNADRYKLLNILEYFLDEVMDTVKLEKESIQSVDLSPVIDDLIELLYSQPFNLPVEWAFIGRTVGTLTGIIAALYPEINLYDELKPYVDRLLNNNIDEIIGQAKGVLKDKLITIFDLPDRVERVINSVEKGELKFRVDFREVDDKLDEIESIFVRTVGFAVGFFSFIGSYVLYFINQKEAAVLLGGLGIISFFYAFFTKKRNKKDIIKKRLL